MSERRYRSAPKRQAIAASSGAPRRVALDQPEYLHRTVPVTNRHQRSSEDRVERKVISRADISKHLGDTQSIAPRDEPLSAPAEKRYHFPPWPSDDALERFFEAIGLLKPHCGLQAEVLDRGDRQAL